MTKRRWLAVALVAALFVPFPTVADDDDEALGPQGLTVTFAGTATDTRHARSLSFYLPRGTAPSPFVAPGDFRATWRGKLVLELGAEFTFSAEGRGTIEVRINDEAVFAANGDDWGVAKGKPVKLKKENAIVVSYAPPKVGDAAMRVFWQSEEIRREPVYWKALRHIPDDNLTSGRRIREGRELFATQRCAKCHAGVPADAAMPEIAQDAPSLAGIADRLNVDWIARWVGDPKTLRPTATMPRVLADDTAAKDVAACLGTLRTEAVAATKPAAEEVVQAGMRLFANLGCIGCHLPPTKDDFADEHQRVPLRDVVAKWRPMALVEFLRQPDKHYEWIRMPNFGLSADEADKLAAYLLSVEKRDLGSAAGGDAAKGKELVAASGCLNCHALKNPPPSSSTLKAPKIANGKWDRGCVADKADAKGKSPTLNLSPEQTAAIRAFGSNGLDSLSRDTATEFAARQMSILRCTACHPRDDREDLWGKLKDEADGLTAGLPPLDPDAEPKEFHVAVQTRPSLTWIGEKLKPEWMETLFLGKLPYKPRPWLRARMPAFPRRARMLAQGLAHEHGCPSVSPADSAVDESLSELGREMSGKKRWGCASCHDIGETTAVGVFEAPGVNFMRIKERLRGDYFDRWLWSPMRLEPGTKMPALYQFGQPSAIQDILGGDPDKQVSALWNYVQTGRKIKPPPD